MTSNNQGANMKQVDLQDGASADIVQENVQHLKELFPDAFTENGVNFDTLRQLLGDLKVLDEGEEKYGLNWHGKKQARQIALTPSLGTLLPCPEESVDWDTTHNLFIDGDNLEVLKLLQKSYANKVKMIYIDPPYNTGKEFIYPDKFQDNLDTYLKYTGQINDEGMKFSSNTETGGRKHTNWLNMMYPRLKLAKSLLRQDGVIFISIDDNEQSNLKQVCDEIFGEENFIGQLIRQTIEGGKQDSQTIQNIHEYCLVYVRSNYLGINRKIIDNYDHYNKEDKYLNERGKYYLKPLENGGLGYVPSLDYAIKGPDDIDIYPGGKHGDNGYRWVWKKDKFKRALELDLIEFTTARSGEGYKVYYKIYQYIDSEGNHIERSSPFKTLYLDGYTNRQGVLALKKDFGNSRIFDYPKPTSFLKELILLGGSDDGIIMDFFAGSGGTATATLELNSTSKNNEKRKFIAVQLPEITEDKSEASKAGYKTISDLSKERIRRAAKKIKDENPEYSGDLGFKVFKLANSNIKVWNPDRTDLEGSLLDHKEHLVEGRSEQDILYELLLKRGVDLTTPIETRQIAGKNVYSIGYGKIITCLDDLIAANDVEPLASGIIAWQKELKDTLSVKVLETHVFFKDSAFRDDVAKTNMAAILSQNGIDHVRSL